MVNELVMVDTLSGYELVQVLIARGTLTNCFEFIERDQMLKLIQCYNNENQTAPIVVVRENT